MKCWIKILFFAKEYMKDFEMLNDFKCSNQEKQQLLDMLLKKYESYFNFYNINVNNRKGSSLLFYDTCRYIYNISEQKIVSLHM